MPNFQIKLARTEEERKQAYRLRYEIFLKELGDNSHMLPAEGIETDIYDGSCDHLVIIDTEKNLTVGTYRLLSGSKVDPKIGFYAEKIFEISKIKNLGKNILELGRSCVHKDYREGLIIDLLWKGIAEYIKQNNIRYLFGSVRLLTTDPLEVSEIFSLIKEKYYAPESMRIRPLKESTFEELIELKVSDCKKTFLKLPALVKGYLRLGLKVYGAPAWDRHLESVVLFVALDINEMTPSYRKHFLGF
jgi:putative hemolysin